MMIDREWLVRLLGLTRGDAFESPREITSQAWRVNLVKMGGLFDSLILHFSASGLLLDTSIKMTALPQGLI